MPAESSALPAPLIVTAPPTDARPARWPWLAVGGLVALALALRLGCLFYLLGPDFVWHDADAYLAKGARLVEAGQFRWTYDAVAYPWGGRVYALPPLFSIYLAPFARFASYPFNAFVGLAVLNALAIPLIVRLGTRLHSLTAGLVGGLLYACWGSDIVGLGQVRQEPLYLPLVIAATLALVRAWDRRGAGPFALAGAAFGLAALCRSMPIYFVAAVAVAARAARLARRRTARGAGARRRLRGADPALQPRPVDPPRRADADREPRRHPGRVALPARRQPPRPAGLRAGGGRHPAGARHVTGDVHPGDARPGALAAAAHRRPLPAGRRLRRLGVVGGGVEGGGARVHRRAVAVRDRPGAARRRGGAQPAGGVAARRVGAAQPRAHRADRLRRLAPPLPVRGARGAPRQHGGRRRLAQAAASARPRPRPRRIDRRRAADGAADRADRCRPGQLRAAVDADRCPHGRAGQRRQRRQRPGLARRPRRLAAQPGVGADSRRPAGRRRRRRPGSR